MTILVPQTPTLCTSGPSKTSTMGSCSRLSRVSRDISSADNYEIYIPFCAKNAAGVHTSAFIQCYTPSTNSWRRAATPIVIPGQHETLVLKDFAMAPLDHHIYVIGGRLCRKPAGQSDTAGSPRVVACVHRYDVRTDTWESSAPMAHQRFNFACTVSDGKIYVAGGQSTLGRATGIASAEVYDPALDRWESLPDMSTARYKCVGVAWQGKIHVFGGFVDDGENQGPFIMKRSSAEVYHSRRNRWDFVAGMWALDVPPYQIAAVNGKLFSSGDCFMPWKGHIDAYDEKENLWNIVRGSRCDCLSPSSAVEMARHRVYLTMAPIENYLYFLAGYRMPGDGARLRSEVYAFDTAANGVGWQCFEPYEEEGEKELCGHCCVLKRESYG
ncbi:uncharacterized protein LOC127240576 [Andrographis paniculata]|uniref:uncharacterized protein LOC127240576 n=1 Tax=Andrographis paniculata TaxID=175694 RepID=UPI0021E73226|nr:uncharacterized protein LOC127240576 [Andrographis paniculata]